LPAGVACTKFRKNPTFKTIVMLLRSLETLNRVFSISQKWDLPGSSTKPFNWNKSKLTYVVDCSFFSFRLDSLVLFSFASHSPPTVTVIWWSYRVTQLH